MTFPQISSSKYVVGGCVDASEFPRIETPLSYEEFFHDFLLPNRPCIFSSAATADWQSRRNWVLKDGTPDFDFFSEHFGEIVVPVADCGKEEYSAHCKQTMKLEEYIEYIQQYKQAGYPAQDKCLYLKDWHFTRDCSEYRAYTTPIYFSSDWLNEFWDTEKDQEDDYRFVYIGPKGSWTSFHADVFRSYSWSANICGRKKWIFFPPGEENKLKDKFGNLMYNVTEEIDESKFPNAKHMKKLEIIQESGEIIFVPSGWHHQVMNLVDTISINHNWINGCGIMRSWNYIKSSLVDVERQIDDCRDMENWYEHCQLILKASSGIDYPEFFDFMSTIARHRIIGIEKFETENNKGIARKQFKENDSIKTPSINTAHGKFANDAEISLESKVKNIEEGAARDSDCLKVNPATNCQKEFDKCSLQTIDKITECESRTISQSGDNVLDLSRKKSKDNEKNFLTSRIDLLPKHNEMSDEDYEIFWRFINLHHAVFDLKRVREVLNDMKSDVNFQKLDYAALNVDEVLNKIDTVVDAYS